MNQRIDLTLNRDFRKRRPRLSKRSVLNLDAPILSLASPDPITQSEVMANFLTGSIDRIKDNQSTLEAMRSIYGIDPICDCCGRPLLVRPSGLCDLCDEYLDNSAITKRIMSLIKS